MIVVLSERGVLFFRVRCDNCAKKASAVWHCQPEIGVRSTFLSGPVQWTHAQYPSLPLCAKTTLATDLQQLCVFLNALDIRFKMYSATCEWTYLLKMFVSNRCLCLRLQMLWGCFLRLDFTTGAQIRLFFTSTKRVLYCKGKSQRASHLN